MGRTHGTYRLAIEIAVRFEILIVLLDQQAPVVVELVQRGQPATGVLHGVEVGTGQFTVAGLDTSRARNRPVGRNVYHRRKCNFTAYIIDITAAVIAVDSRAQRQLALDQRNVERGIETVVRITTGRDAVARVDVALGDVELRLVRDVADRTGLGAAAEQRALRAFQNFDALHVNQIDVGIAGRELHPLVIQIQGDVRERRSRRLRLVAGSARAQAAQENVAGARTIAAEGDVRGVLHQIAEAGHVQLLQLITGDRLNRDGHALDVFRASLRGHHDLLEAPRARRGGRIRGPGLRSKSGGGASGTQYGQHGASYGVVRVQVDLPDTC